MNATAPRLYVDFNSGDEDGSYWIALFEDQRVDDVIERLGFYDRMPIVAYYSDDEDEFEFDGHLVHRPNDIPRAPQWRVIINEDTFRRLRSSVPS